ncbi:MAG: hypothetical protein GX829_06590, partial [Clostridium sp.]|nr:hypothetical protein [Clostridium sp.]
IPGVGDRRRKNLMVRFGSIEAIREASIEELNKTPAIDKKTATSIHTYFHGEKHRKAEKENQQQDEIL